MPRNFASASDLVTVPGAPLATFTSPVIGTLNAGKRYSHPDPLLLANGNILLLHSTNEDNTSGSYVIKCATSTDGGLTFASPVTVANTSGSGTNAFESSAIQLANGTIVAVYDLGTSVRQKTSTDNGATWSVETTVTATAATEPHPSLCLNGTTLVLAYRDSASGISIKKSTDDGATWGSAIVVTSTNTRKDPCIRVMPNGDLLCMATDTSSFNIYSYRSTDGGSTWGSAVQVVANAVSDNANAFLTVSGTTVWLTYSTGTLNSGATAGTRVVKSLYSRNSGSTWSAQTFSFSTTTTDDRHRLHALVYSGGLIGFCTDHNSDNEFHISRLALDARFYASVNAGTQTALDNVTSWTAWAWVKQSTYNAAGNGFVLAKAGFGRVYIQLKDGGSGAPDFHVFVNRATTATDYKTGSNPSGYTKGSWGFVAMNFDDSRGNTNRCKCFIGTTPANLAEVSLSVVAEGSGTIVDDSAQPFTIGGKYADTARNYIGDAGRSGIASGNLSLAQLQAVMRNVQPVGVLGWWPMATAQASVATDSSVNGNDGIITGTTASGTENPEFAPADPSSLTATAFSSSRIDLTWTDNSDNETEFLIEQSATGSGGWSTVTTTAANATSYSHTGLIGGTAYYYRISAVNAAGASGYATAHATTAAAGSSLRGRALPGSLRHRRPLNRLGA